MRDMKITFIKHSCFSVELERHVLLFDYYGEGSLPEWDKNKTIYVLNSHKHADHFNLCIFELRDKYPDIHFFLGTDIRLSERYLERNHVVIDRDKEITHLAKRITLSYEPEFTVRTLKSTDVGVAFVIQCENVTIYHAGDLNWWHWEGESAAFNDAQKTNYQEEIAQLSGECFDIAFIPLDGRLENAYYMGMDYFLQNVEVKKVFPMHMWDDFSYIARYKKEGYAGADKLVDIEEDGQVWTGLGET